MLKDILQHQFTDQALLQQALTHRSGHASVHNERLEFLGDRVLNLAVAELLYQHYPQANEGELAKRHAALVRESTLATVARQWQLGAHLHMSDAEAESGGAEKDSILADAVEAILAALYLDAGWQKVQKVVVQYWPPLFEQVALQDPKTALQEWLQARGEALPIYEEISTTGPQHNQVFVIAVSAASYGRAEGQGRTKQQASQQAAQQLLTQLEAKL